MEIIKRSYLVRVYHIDKNTREMFFRTCHLAHNEKDAREAAHRFREEYKTEFEGKEQRWTVDIQRTSTVLETFQECLSEEEMPS